jgi:hypothetical protein
MREWWPIAVLAVAIVGIGAVWFTRWVIERLEKDRSKLHDHAGKIQIHELRIDEHEDAIKALKDKGKR